MSCTNDSPCKQPMLRWVHSDRCKEITTSIRKIDTLAKRILALEGQLPEGMKDCTIVLRTCPKGHSWLTATNWVEHNCLVCLLKEVSDSLRKIESLCKA